MAGPSGAKQAQHGRVELGIEKLSRHSKERLSKTVHSKAGQAEYGVEKRCGAKDAWQAKLCLEERGRE